MTWPWAVVIINLFWACAVWWTASMFAAASATKRERKSTFDGQS